MNALAFRRTPGYTPAMVTVHAVIRNEHGIHCRPSAVIIREIGDYDGHIELTCAHGDCNPRSMLGLMSMGLECGTEVTIQVEGPDEAAMAARLKELFETRFDFEREG